MKVISFDQFVEMYPKFGKCRSSLTAPQVFDFLSEPNQIHSMIEANSQGRVALSGCVQELERRFRGQVDFDFTDDFVRQTVGVMVKAILLPFGYLSDIQRNMPAGKAEYFKSGMNYRYEPQIAEYELIATFEVRPIHS